MSKKLNIKTLLIIFGVLLALIVIVNIADKDKGERTFKSEIVDIDTSKITALTIIPRLAEEGEIRIYKDGGKWILQNKGVKYNAAQDKIKEVLTALLNMRPKNIAAISKEKWGTYEVADSNMVSRVKAEVKGKVVADVVIGKFSYQQPKTQNPYQMYGQQQGTMTTYVRPAEDETVYAVDGFLAMTFSPDLSAYRNKTVVKVKKEDVSKVSFNYPDSSFVLIKQNDKWMVDGLIADSLKVDKYLKSISILRSSTFVDDMVDAAIVPSHKVTIEGNNMLGAIEVSASPSQADSNYIITSSQNQGTNFTGTDSDVFNKLFVSKSKFLTD